MGWADRANPGSKVNERARMARARWLVQQLGREQVEAKLPEMDIPDQAIVRQLLDELYPVTLH